MAQFGGSTMNLSTFKPTSAEKLAHSQLVKDLERFYNFTDKEHQSQVFFKVPFERILDLVKGRQVIVRNGFAYVPRSTQTVLLINLFKDRLEASLEELAAVMPNIDDDDRVNSILSSLGKQHSSSVGNSFIAAEGKVKFTHADIDDLSLHHFAPCMKNLHLNLRENNHLKHFARLQYGLFLKGI